MASSELIDRLPAYHHRPGAEDVEVAVKIIIAALLNAPFSGRAP
jgi:hypothetical protein